MRIAVIGAGISGLGVSYLLSGEHEVDVYEREPRFGGHAHTHAIEHAGRQYRLDTGFLVYNTRTYPQFTRLLERLGIDTQWSDMSFSVRCQRCRLEYGSRHVGALFAQPSRLVDPTHWRLLLGIWRLFGAGRRFLSSDRGYDVSLGRFIDEGAIGDDVARHFLLPMTGAIWSANGADMASPCPCQRADGARSRRALIAGRAA